MARGDLRPPAGGRVLPTGNRDGAPPALGPRLGRPARTASNGWRRGSWSASPAFLSYTDAQLARLFAFLEETGDARQHTGHAGLRQRGEFGRGPERLDQRQPPGEHRPGRARRAGAAHRRARRSERPQQLSVGLDHGRQHAVQAVEARGPRGRGGRPLHRELARSTGRPGRNPPPVRPRRGRPPDRPRADRGRPAQHHRAMSPRRPSTASASPRCWRPTARDGPGTGPPSTSRCSAAGPSTTTAGRPSPTSPSARSTTTASTGTRRSARTAGSSTTWPTTRPRSTTWPSASPNGLPISSSGGGSRLATTRCCPSTTVCCTPSSTRSPTGGLPVSASPTTRAPRRSPKRWRPT